MALAFYLRIGGIDAAFREFVSRAGELTGDTPPARFVLIPRSVVNVGHSIMGFRSERPQAINQSINQSGV